MNRLNNSHPILLLFFLFYSPSIHCEPNDPQQLIAHFENNVQGLSPEKRDSIKNTLLSAYIQEYRNIGKDAALDSLQLRVNLLLNNKERNREKTINREPAGRKPASSSKNTPPDAASLMISKEIRRTKQIADSLTSEALKTGKETIIAPIYFDSINHADFLNYMPVSKLKYKNPTDTKQSVNNSITQKQDLFLFQNKQKRRTTNALAISHPELIEFYGLAKYDSKGRDIRQANKKIVSVDVEDYRANPVFEKLSDFLKPKKQSMWSSSGKLNIQFSQYYVTKNWYKGGDPNATLLSLLEYYKDYNNNDKLIWNNSLDVKIGFFNSGNDTLRAFRVNNDVFKINSRLGYRTFLKKWYYSLSGEFNTSMFTSYAGTNSSEIVTAFLSPTRIFMSLGLDYRYNKNTSVLIAPAAYKLIFLTSNQIDPLSVGIANGKSSNNFGYMLQAKINWQFTREINVNSNFNLFSTYNFKNVEFNWETIGNFTINRYLSTRLSLNMRYDNTPKKPDKTEKSKFVKPKLQIQEQLSFGFYYKF